MHREQRQRTDALLRERGITHALFAHPDSVTWLTGYAPPVEMGPYLFAGGPALVWYERAGASAHFTLLIMDIHTRYAQAFAMDADARVETYASYTVQEPMQPTRSLEAALSKVLENAVGNAPSATIGVEMSLPAHLYAILGANTRADVTNITDWLLPLRMIKTDEELDVLRHAFALTDVGHQAARDVIQAGRREIDIWMDIHREMSRAAGRRIPMGNDCTVNTHEFNIGAPPTEAVLPPNGSIMIDLSIRWNGYWSDSCCTYYPAIPTREQAKTHRFIREALDYAIGLLKPGVRANAVDQQVRAFIERGGYPVYPHHSGHGIGVSLHEEPRIVPYDETVLQPGMVIMVEPGTYVGGISAMRLEDAVLITSDGPQILTRHGKRMPGE